MSAVRTASKYNSRHWNMNHRNAVHKSLTVCSLLFLLTVPFTKLLFNITRAERSLTPTRAPTELESKQKVKNCREISLCVPQIIRQCDCWLMSVGVLLLRSSAPFSFYIATISRCIYMVTSNLGHKCINILSLIVENVLKRRIFSRV